MSIGPIEDPHDFMQQGQRHLLPEEEMRSINSFGHFFRPGVIDSTQIAIEKELYKRSLKDYTVAMWPHIEPGREFADNWHIDCIADHLQACRDKEIRRLLINIPFRCMKSILVSIGYPTWIWCNEPGHQFFYVSHAERLALRDAMKSRRVIQTNWYQERWGDKVQFAVDQNNKHKYETREGGYRVSFGFLSNYTGEGADTIVVDDPHDRDQAFSVAERTRALDQFDQKLMTRLNDPASGCVIIIMQRLHEEDVSGHVLSEIGGYTHLKIPMEYVPGQSFSTGIRNRRESEKKGETVIWKDPRSKEKELMWEKRFPPNIIAELKTTLGSYGYSGQMQQEPSPDEGGLLKRTYWRPWRRVQMPPFQYILQVWDTAVTEKQMSDYSARITFGIFVHPFSGKLRAMMLEAFRKKLEYPELRKEAQKAYTKYRADEASIEVKSSGMPLIQDLTRAGLTISPFHPVGRYGMLDKVARAQVIAPILENGAVYYPCKIDTLQDEIPEPRDWVLYVIDECAAFPASKNDDLTDCVTQGLMVLTQRGLLENTNDPTDDVDEADEPSDDVTDEVQYYG